MILNTIYSRDEQLFSIGNYEERSYYQIITNSDGDDVIDETDAANSFNSAEFNDGDYIIKINARDAAGNASSIFKQVTFDNGVNVSDNEVEKIKTLTQNNEKIENIMPLVQEVATLKAHATEVQLICLAKSKEILTDKQLEFLSKR